MLFFKINHLKSGIGKKTDTRTLFQLCTISIFVNKHGHHLQ